MFTILHLLHADYHIRVGPNYQQNFVAMLNMISWAHLFSAPFRIDDTAAGQKTQSSLSPTHWTYEYICMSLSLTLHIFFTDSLLVFHWANLTYVSLWVLYCKTGSTQPGVGSPPRSGWCSRAVLCLCSTNTGGCWLRGTAPWLGGKKQLLVYQEDRPPPPLHTPPHPPSTS